MRSQVSVKSDHRWHFSHAAEFCFATAMLGVPRRHRFAAAALIARTALPLFRRTAAYREQQIKKLHSPYEIALYLVLNALMKNGTRFDPMFEVQGYEEFERAYAAGKGVLVIGPHAALTLLMVRHFYDRGLDPVVISPDPRLRVGGTNVTAKTVQPSPTFLVKTRSRLRRGELVCAMPDRAEHREGRTVEFATANGRVIFAPALMQVAARCGAEVIFTEVHLEGHRLVGTIAAPSSSAGAAEALTQDFMEFVRACAARQAARVQLQS
jgi:lauroyl/myristoyl acyltransferase